MPPVISKPVALNGNSTEPQSQYGNHNDNVNENVYLDPNLADIISNAVSQIKLNQLIKSKKKRRSEEVVSFHAQSVVKM